MATGWDNGLCQDYDLGLGRWFADRIDARYVLRRNLMQPTMELRFVERWIGEQQKWVRVLQQKWRHKDWPIVVDTEWRDVPLVKEEA